ncbi:MAG TPA: anion permease [Anaerolineaceae bacterium]|nr:anion permease [Anaerolineaceae bacterium]
MSLSLLILIGLGVAYAFLNGVHDSSSIVATMISSRAIQPRAALLLTAVAEFAGPLVFGIAVANTIGREIADAQFLNIQVIIAALLSAIIWNVLTWVLAIPSSSSHALIGGIIGAVVMGAGFKAILMAGVAKVLISLFISPILGFLTGYLFAQLVFLLSWKASPRINGVFRKLQIITSFGLALSHGSNDAPKSMGLITLGLLVSGQIDQFVVPDWVVLMGAGAIALGTATGGWQLIRTLGSKFYRIRPIHGFSAQVSSAIVTLTASLLGGPTSTTQVVSTAIMGVGAAERLSKVRWGVAGEILSTWLITIPATGLLAAGIYWLIEQGFPALISLL